MVSSTVAQAIRLVFLIGFFGFAAICIIYARKTELAKRAFVIVLVVGLLIPTVTGAMLPPFAQWVFFPNPAPQHTTQYSVVVVDDAGVEHAYPAEAAPPGRVDTRAELIVTEYDEELREETAAYLLERARIYRGAIADGISPLELVRFGRFSGRAMLGEDSWTIEEVERIGELRGIRIYQDSISTSDDGTRITTRSRTIAYEHWGNETGAGGGSS